MALSQANASSLWGNKVQFIPFFHRAGKIGAVGGSTTAWIKIYNHIVAKRSGWGKFYHSDPTKFLGGENATEQTLVFPGFGTTGIDWSSFVLSFGFENLSWEEKNTRYLDFFKAREKLWFCWHWSGQPEYWAWTNSGVNFSQKWNEIQRIWNRFFKSDPVFAFRPATCTEHWLLGTGWGQHYRNCLL